MSRRTRANSIDGQFVAHRVEMRESPAWRHLPDDARRILDRLEVEHMRHAGRENGFLICTYRDFASAGVREASVALALRQCECLGFIRITNLGQRSSAQFRNPNSYFVTHLNGWDRSIPATDEWRNIKTDEDAVLALAAAAGTKRRETQPRRKREVAHAA